MDTFSKPEALDGSKNAAEKKSNHRGAGGGGSSGERGLGDVLPLERGLLRHGLGDAVRCVHSHLEREIDRLVLRHTLTS